MIDLGIQFSVAVFLALFFAGSGFHKFTHRSDFKTALAGYNIVSGVPLKFIAFIMPIIEILTAVLVLIPELRVLGGGFAVILFSFYGLMIVIALMRGQAGVDCGCSWGNSERSTPLTAALVYRNIILSLIAGITLIEAQAREIFWLDWITAVMTAVAAILIYQAFEAYNSVVEFQKEHSR